MEMDRTSGTGRNSEIDMKIEGESNLVDRRLDRKDRLELDT